MGYAVDCEIEAVLIPSRKVGAAIKALKRLMGEVQEKGGGGSFSPGKEPVHHYSWVSTDSCLQYLEQGNLVAFLDEWRYEATEADSMTPVEQLARGEDFRDVHINWFSGTKWGDEEQLWIALSPFIADGGSVAYRGEDGALWRYVFSGGKIDEQAGSIEWG